MRLAQHPHEIAIGKCPMQVALERGKIASAVEIIHHDESAAIDEFPEVLLRAETDQVRELLPGVLKLGEIRRNQTKSGDPLVP